MKTKLIVAALLSALAVLTPRAWAVNLQDAQTAQADQTAFSAYVIGGAGQSDLAHLYYIGTSTESVITISATHMIFFAPYNVAEATLSSTGGIGTLGDITYSGLGSNTMGGLCDYINSTKYYRCQLTGALRTDAPAILKTQTQTAGTCMLNSAGGCKLTNNAADIIRLGILPPSGRRVVLQQVISNGQASTDSVKVQGILRNWNGLNDNLGTAVTADTAVYSIVDAGANTTGYYPSQYSYAPWIEFKTNLTNMSMSAGLLTSPVTGTAYDGRVVISLGATGSGTAETSTNFIEAQAMLK